MFPGKKLRRNFTAETIAKRSRAFEQYLCHLCSLSALQRALCVRSFFYLADLQAGQLLIRYFCFLSDVEFYIVTVTNYGCREARCHRITSRLKGFFSLIMKKSM